MPWTNDQKVSALLRLPWTINVLRSDGYFVSHVLEIPSALATADSADDLEDETWASLRASLEVYVENGDAVPLPSGVAALPWEVKPAAPPVIYAPLRVGEVWNAAVSRASDEAALTRAESLVAT
jgi:predicted RNase H-like HicB family nuclease